MASRGERLLRSLESLQGFPCRGPPNCEEGSPRQEGCFAVPLQHDLREYRKALAASVHAPSPRERLAGLVRCGPAQDAQEWLGVERRLRAPSPKPVQRRPDLRPQRLHREEDVRRVVDAFLADLTYVPDLENHLGTFTRLEKRQTLTGYTYHPARQPRLFLRVHLADAGELSLVGVLETYLLSVVLGTLQLGLPVLACGLAPHGHLGLLLTPYWTPLHQLKTAESAAAVKLARACVDLVYGLAACGVVWADIKPANLVALPGEPPLVRAIDLAVDHMAFIESDDELRTGGVAAMLLLLEVHSSRLAEKSEAWKRIAEHLKGELQRLGEHGWSCLQALLHHDPKARRTLSRAHVAYAKGADPFAAGAGAPEPLTTRLTPLQLADLTWHLDDALPRRELGLVALHGWLRRRLRGLDASTEPPELPHLSQALAARLQAAAARRLRLRPGDGLVEAEARVMPLAALLEHEWPRPLRRGGTASWLRPRRSFACSPLASVGLALLPAAGGLEAYPEALVLSSDLMPGTQPEVQRRLTAAAIMYRLLLLDVLLRETPEGHGRAGWRQVRPLLDELAKGSPGLEALQAMQALARSLAGARREERLMAAQECLREVRRALRSVRGERSERGERGERSERGERGERGERVGVDRLLQEAAEEVADDVVLAARVLRGDFSCAWDDV